jgi:hypothetical protein
MKVLITKSLGALLLLGIFVACKKTPEQKANYAVKKISRTLDLTDDQLEKLNALKDEVLAASKRQLTERESMFNEVKGLIVSDRLPEGEVKGLMVRKNQIRLEEFPSVFPKLQAFHASLSAEQKEEIVQIANKLYKKFYQK